MAAGRQPPAPADTLEPAANAMHTIAKQMNWSRRMIATQLAVRGGSIGLNG
jgi:hypothetical protein